MTGRAYLDLLDSYGIHYHRSGRRTVSVFSWLPGKNYQVWVQVDQQTGRACWTDYIGRLNVNGVVFIPRDADDYVYLKTFVPKKKSPMKNGYYAGQAA